MKQFFSIVAFFFNVQVIAQNVGIGIATPDEKLQVDSIIRVGKNAVIPLNGTKQNLIKFGDGNFVTVGEQDKDDRLVMKASSFTFKTGSVGIGVDSAKEKLDVAGNANISGQLKLNGNAGLANQVLMKDASNNAVWGDISNYKNIYVIDCGNITTVAGNDNCTSSWQVPAGVTELLVECWAGGGGGGFATGGGGGGYVTAKIPVTPSGLASITVGAGGYHATLSSNSVIGGSTIFSFNGNSITAFGGNGGDKTNLFSFSTANVLNVSGGEGTASANLYNKAIVYIGGEPGITKISYAQINATDFCRIFQFGDGGSTPFMNLSAPKGGYSVVGTGVNQNLYAYPYSTCQGCGGAADMFYGSSGRGGRIIIHY